MNRVFSIKPLVWEQYRNPLYAGESFVAKTPFGAYEVNCLDDGSVQWGYIFCEECDEDWFTGCKSIDEAKTAAQSNWIERLARALDEKA